MEGKREGAVWSSTVVFQARVDLLSLSSTFYCSEQAFDDSRCQKWFKKSRSQFLDSLPAHTKLQHLFQVAACDRKGTVYLLVLPVFSIDSPMDLQSLSTFSAQESWSGLSPVVFSSTGVYHGVNSVSLPTPRRIFLAHNSNSVTMLSTTTLRKVGQFLTPVMGADPFSQDYPSDGLLASPEGRTILCKRGSSRYDVLAGNTGKRVMSLKSPLLPDPPTLCFAYSGNLIFSVDVNLKASILDIKRRKVICNTDLVDINEQYLRSPNLLQVDGFLCHELVTSDFCPCFCAFNPESPDILLIGYERGQEQLAEGETDVPTQSTAPASTTLGIYRVCDDNLQLLKVGTIPGLVNNVCWGGSISINEVKFDMVVGANEDGTVSIGYIHLTEPWTTFKTTTRLGEGKALQRTNDAEGMRGVGAVSCDARGRLNYFGLKRVP